MSIMKKLLATILFASFVLVVYARDNKQWMKDIDDSYPLTMMSIPGTHDTGTGHGFPEAYEYIGEMTARTQQLLLAEQWDAGIRAFDLRPRAVDGVLKIYHGITETKLIMAGALFVLKLMIHEYPTEGAIIIMQNEGDSSGWDLLMKDLLKAYVDNGLLIDYRPDLTMGDLRGHVVVLSRSEYDEEGKPYGGYIEGWPGTLVSTPNPIEGNIKYNGGSSKVVIQDYYQNVVPATKNNSIGNLLQASDDSRKKGTVSNTLYINHCSGYVPYSGLNIVKAILQNAEATNAYASDIIEGQTNMVTGLVMIDFAGVDTHVYNGTEYNVQGARLVNAVINSNDYNYTKITEVVGDDNAVNSKSIYNLSGQRLNRLQKGFNIVGGKKVIIQ